MLQVTSNPIEVPAPDLAAAQASADRRASLPPGALGEFAAIVDTLAALRRDLQPAKAPISAHLSVFAGDHGIADQDVSADLPIATARRAADIAAGRGFTAGLARQAGVSVSVLDLAIDADGPADLHGTADPGGVDVIENETRRIDGDYGTDNGTNSNDGSDNDDGTDDGTDNDDADSTDTNNDDAADDDPTDDGIDHTGPINSGVINAKVRRSSGRIDIEDALTQQEVARAIQAGRDEANTRVDDGADLLIGALCGVGAATAAAALAAYLTGVEPVDATGRGTGVDDDGWIRRAAAVRDARFRLTVGSSDAATLLRVGGGADIAALTGFILQAAVRGIPVLLDDVAGAVAAVLAHRFAPGAERYVLVPTTTPGAVHRRLVELLRTKPLTALQLGPGVAVPSLLLLPTIRMAISAVDAARPGPALDRAPWAIDNWDLDLL